jgi:hypothetical protein
MWRWWWWGRIGCVNTRTDFIASTAAFDGRVTDTDAERDACANSDACD